MVVPVGAAAGGRFTVAVAAHANTALQQAATEVAAARAQTGHVTEEAQRAVAEERAAMSAELQRQMDVLKGQWEAKNGEVVSQLNAQWQSGHATAMKAQKDELEYRLQLELKAAKMSRAPRAPSPSTSLGDTGGAQLDMQKPAVTG